jgi:hypothetical protein
MKARILDENVASSLNDLAAIMKYLYFYGSAGGFLRYSALYVMLAICSAE